MKPHVRYLTGFPRGQPNLPPHRNYDDNDNEVDLVCVAWRPYSTTSLSTLRGISKKKHCSSLAVLQRWRLKVQTRVSKATHVLHVYILLNLWSSVLLEKLTGSQLVKEFPCILWNPKLLYRIYNSPPPVVIQSQLNSVHSLHSTSRRSILILSSHLCLGLPSVLFPSGFPTKILYAPLLSPTRAKYSATIL